jgi:hypothetical protein
MLSNSQFLLLLYFSLSLAHALPQLDQTTATLLTSELLHTKAPLIARGETAATLATFGLAPIETPSLAMIKVRATSASLPNGAEVESGEGIRKKAVSADFASVMKESGVVGRGVRGGVAAMVSGWLEKKGKSECS